MKVYCAEDRLVSASGKGVENWCAPWTAAAIRSCTAANLARRGALVEDPASASLILVEVTDHLAHLAAESLVALAAQGRAAGARLVVRIHGAWRHQAGDFGETEEPDLRAVWSTADAVLVASRHHLVRLACGGGIDADRTRLAPVAMAEPDVTSAGCPELGSRTQLLVAGETHRAALAPVLEMLREADPSKATLQVISAATPFQRALGTARALLVPATAPFGDRVLVDAALRAGVTVIASEGAGALDGPLPQGLTVVAGSGSSAKWREALEAGLTSSIVPEARALDAILERQYEILTAIDAQEGAPGAHFEREAAA
ncbi:hypothetical protein Poly30_37620 [Planctomycetes bacterium Poly30]|uniref:Uncharacterized protein n=1 Tax=Saltatorellus ferox TaxID=2528018 RepID=A0A518EVV9_9BACT|nr:hypothetical protein Poly30_37620 [Planctomycetes bacterium Poly30]